MGTRGTKLRMGPDPSDRLRTEASHGGRQEWERMDGGVGCDDKKVLDVHMAVGIPAGEHTHTRCGDESGRRLQCASCRAFWVVLVLAVGALPRCSTSSSPGLHDATSIPWEVWPQEHDRNNRRIGIVEDKEGGGGGRRIIGGRPAGSKYPWAVQISKVGGQALTCSGQLIGGRWILTAAHCVMTTDLTGYRDVGPPGSTQVTVGCDDLNSASCRTLNVYRIIVHPCHTPSIDQKHDDIAMMELYDDPGVATLPYIAGLNGTVEFGNGTNVTLAGFGITDNVEKIVSSRLLEVDVPVASQKVCEGSNPMSYSYKFINFTNVICTGGHDGQDSCGGDSGGPAIYKAGGKDWIVGVLSKGSELPLNSPDCGVKGRFGVYTRISRYTDFLREIMFNVPYACSSCPCTCEGPTCGDISRALPWAAVPSQYPATTSELTAPVTTPIPAQEPSAAVSFVGFIVMGVGFTVLLASGVAVLLVFRLRKTTEAKITPFTEAVPSGHGSIDPAISGWKSPRASTITRLGSNVSTVPMDRQFSVGSMALSGVPALDMSQLGLRRDSRVFAGSVPTSARTASGVPTSARTASGVPTSARASGLQQRRASLSSPPTAATDASPRRTAGAGWAPSRPTTTQAATSSAGSKPPKPVPAAVVPHLEIGGGFRSSGATPVSSGRAPPSFELVHGSSFKTSAGSKASEAGPPSARPGGFVGRFLGALSGSNEEEVREGASLDSQWYRSPRKTPREDIVILD